MSSSSPSTKTPKKEGLVTVAENSKKIPKISSPARCDSDVFISTQETQTKLKQLLAVHNLLFIRAGVATGKTTMVENWSKYDNNVVLVRWPSFGKESEYMTNIVNAINGTSVTSADTSDVEAALETARTKGTLLVFDEAHLLFSSTNLVQLLINASPLHVLFVSAASEPRNNSGETTTTPKEITGKFMWYPPPPIASTLRSDLGRAAVRLDTPSIEFLVDLSGNHRGILMCCLGWVQQKQASNANETWSIGKTITEVRAALDQGTWAAGAGALWDEIMKSRAVKVNGQFSDMPNIPLDFIYLLCEGPKVLKPGVRRLLTIHGFVLPVPTGSDNELVEYDWTMPNVVSAVANPMLAWFYYHHLEESQGLKTSLCQQPMTCVDLLLTALPMMSFLYVVCKGTSHNGQERKGTSAENLPFEANYTSAIMKALVSKNIDAGDLQDVKGGKIDLYVRQRADDGCEVTFALEGIMAKCPQSGSRDAHDEHRKRFDGLTNYAEADHKCLFTIGKSETLVYSRVAKTKASGVTVVGIVAETHHSRYKLFIKNSDVTEADDQTWLHHDDGDATAVAASVDDASDDTQKRANEKLKMNHPKIVGPLTVECNRVAMRFDTESKKLVSNQRFAAINYDGEWKSNIWVRGDDGTSFKVTPATNDIDSLKGAIKAELPKSIAEELMSARITILDPDTKKPVQKQSAPLKVNSEEYPYQFVLPTGS